MNWEDSTQCPLSGTFVADFSHGVAGPFCTMYLADLGATVVKVERPGRGDGSRYMSVSETFAAGIPDVGGDYYLSINRNKRSVAIDLKTREGRAIAKALVRRADVVVENFSMGVMDALGLGYSELATDNKRLVYCSIRAYGDTGPLADEVGMDVAIQARSGVMRVTGYPGSPPVKPGSSLADLSGGLNAATGILAALLDRQRSDRGRHVEVSLLDATAMMLVNYSVPVLNSDVEIEPMGSGHPQLVPFQAFETSDGWVVVAAGTNERWRRFCSTIHLDELATDERFATNSDRVRHRRALLEYLEPKLRSRTTAEWLAAFKESGVPTAPILTMREAMNQPHLMATGTVTEVAHPTLGALRLLANPIRIDGGTFPIHAPPPRLGEHTRDVLIGDLQFSAEEVDAWAAGGIIGVVS